MPIDKDTDKSIDGKIYVADINGEKIVLGRLDNAELTPDENEDSMLSAYIDNRFMSATFTITWGLASNNWRKLHGLPMRRRKGRC